MKSLLIRLAATVLMVGATCTDSETATDRPSAPTGTSGNLQQAVTIDGITEHLNALQAIADANDGTRASGTPGFDESARYVADQLKSAGYKVTFQEFVFPFWFEQSPPELAFTSGREFSEGE